VKYSALPFALTLLVGLLPIGLGFAEPSSVDLVREAADRLSLQTEMPDVNSGLPAGTADPTLRPQTATPLPESEPRTDKRDPAVDAPVHRVTFHALPDIIRFLLWGAVILGVIVVAWFLRDSLPIISRSRKITAPETAPPSLLQSSRMEEARLEADDLARQGHYSEAMHLLLLNSLSEIRRQLGVSFAVSLTSREILRRTQLPDIGRQSLSAIIRSVERTYFGGDDADQGDYADCRGNFENLKQSLATVAGP
jgi:hypothetical protein